MDHILPSCRGQKAVKRNRLTLAEKCGRLRNMEKAALIPEGFVEVPGIRAPSGVYLLLGAEGEVLYAGQAKQIYQRITTHYNKDLLLL